MNILGYELQNAEKVDRAIFGAMSRGGALAGGVGENATDEAKLAAYDKLGGLILKDNHKVKMGSFWDFAKNKAREKPEVMLELRDLLGNKIEIAEGEAIPLEVKAAEMIEEKKVKKVKKIKKLEE